MKPLRETFPVLAAFVASLFLFTSCATRIDWNSRVGNYTYDQAVLEMGPPDRMAILSDGRKVGEWMTFRGRTGHRHYAPLFYSPYHHPLYDTWSHNEPSFPDQFVRLKKKYKS